MENNPLDKKFRSSAIEPVTNTELEDEPELARFGIEIVGEERLTKSSSDDIIKTMPKGFEAPRIDESSEAMAEALTKAQKEAGVENPSDIETDPVAELASNIIADGYTWGEYTAEYDIKDKTAPQIASDWANRSMQKVIGKYIPQTDEQKEALSRVRDLYRPRAESSLIKIRQQESRDKEVVRGEILEKVPADDGLSAGQKTEIQSDFVSVWFYPGFEKFNNIYEDSEQAPGLADVSQIFDYSDQELERLIEGLAASRSESEANPKNNVSDPNQLTYWMYKAEELQEARGQFVSTDPEAVLGDEIKQLEEEYDSLTNNILFKKLKENRYDFIKNRNLSKSDQLKILAKDKFLQKLIDKKTSIKEKFEDELKEKGVEQGSLVVVRKDNGFIVIGRYDRMSSSGNALIKGKYDDWVDPREINLVTQPPEWWLERVENLEGDTDRVLGIYQHFAEEINNNYSGHLRGKLVDILRFPEKYLERPLYSYTYEELSQILVESGNLDLLETLDNTYRNQVEKSGGNLESFDKSPIGYILNWKDDQQSSLETESDQSVIIGKKALIKTINKFINQIKQIIDSDDQEELSKSSPTKIEVNDAGEISESENGDELEQDAEKQTETIEFIKNLSYKDLYTLVKEYNHEINNLRGISRIFKTNPNFKGPKRKNTDRMREQFERQPILFMMNASETLSGFKVDRDLARPDLQERMKNFAERTIPWLSRLGIDKMKEVLLQSQEESGPLSDADAIKSVPSIDQDEAIIPDSGNAIEQVGPSRLSPVLELAITNLSAAEAMAQQFADQEKFIEPDERLLDKLRVTKDDFDSLVNEDLPALLGINPTTTKAAIGMANRLIVNIYHDIEDIDTDDPAVRIVAILFTDTVEGIRLLAKLRSEGY